MRIIVSYDISTLNNEGKSRLRKVVKICKSFGVRVQYSIFECSVNEKQLIEIKHKVLKVIDKKEDSLCIYYLSSEPTRITEHYGVRPPLDTDGVLMV